MKDPENNFKLLSTLLKYEGNWKNFDKIIFILFYMKIYLFGEFFFILILKLTQIFEIVYQVDFKLSFKPVVPTDYAVHSLHVAALFASAEELSPARSAKALKLYKTQHWGSPNRVVKWNSLNHRINSRLLITTS